MIEISIDDLKVDGCQIEATVKTMVAVRIKGSAEGSAAGDLEKLFSKVHEECVRLSAVRARIDLTELEFMSSSCFKSFVSWVVRIEQLPEDQRYHIVLLSSPTRHWQRRSLHALESMGGDIISVEPVIGA